MEEVLVVEEGLEEEVLVVVVEDFVAADVARKGRMK